MDELEEAFRLRSNAKQKIFRIRDSVLHLQRPTLAQLTALSDNLWTAFREYGEFHSRIVGILPDDAFDQQEEEYDAFDQLFDEVNVPLETQLIALRHEATQTPSATTLVAHQLHPDSTYNLGSSWSTPMMAWDSDQPELPGQTANSTLRSRPSNLETEVVLRNHSPPTSDTPPQLEPSRKNQTVDLNTASRSPISSTNEPTSAETERVMRDFLPTLPVFSFRCPKRKEPTTTASEPVAPIELPASASLSIADRSNTKCVSLQVEQIDSNKLQTNCVLPVESANRKFEAVATKVFVLERDPQRIDIHDKHAANRLTTANDHGEKVESTERTVTSTLTVPRASAEPGRALQGNVSRPKVDQFTARWPPRLEPIAIQQPQLAVVGTTEKFDQPCAFRGELDRSSQLPTTLNAPTIRVKAEKEPRPAAAVKEPDKPREPNTCRHQLSRDHSGNQTKPPDIATLIPILANETPRPEVQHESTIGHTRRSLCNVSKFSALIVPYRFLYKFTRPKLCIDKRRTTPRSSTRAKRKSDLDFMRSRKPSALLQKILPAPPNETRENKPLVRRPHDPPGRNPPLNPASSRITVRYTQMQMIQKNCTHRCSPSHFLFNALSEGPRSTTSHGSTWTTPPDIAAATVSMNSFRLKLYHSRFDKYHVKNSAGRGTGRSTNACEPCGSIDAPTQSSLVKHGNDFRNKPRQLPSNRRLQHSPQLRWIPEPRPYRNSTGRLSRACKRCPDEHSSNGQDWYPHDLHAQSVDERGPTDESEPIHRKCSVGKRKFRFQIRLASTNDDTMLNMPLNQLISTIRWSNHRPDLRTVSTMVRPDATIHHHSVERSERQSICENFGPNKKRKPLGFFVRILRCVARSCSRQKKSFHSTPRHVVRCNQRKSCKQPAHSTKDLKTRLATTQNATEGVAMHLINISTLIPLLLICQRQPDEIVLYRDASTRGSMFRTELILCVCPRSTTPIPEGSATAETSRHHDARNGEKVPLLFGTTTTRSSLDHQREDTAIEQVPPPATRSNEL